MTSHQIGSSANQSADCPVTIVGGGPAGLVSAIILANAGRRVIVQEARTTVGARFHGDFQGLENWSDETDALDELALHGIEPTFEHHPVHSGIAFDAWGERYTVESSRPLYYLVRRGPGDGTLDQELLRQTVAAGVEVQFGRRVNNLSRQGILAGGPRRADVIAAGYLFETDMADGSWICFDNSLAPDGYSYLLIHNGRGTVASCMFTGFKRQAEFVQRTVAMFKDRLNLKMRNESPFGGYGNFRLPRTAVQGGHPVVGEQAGFQDALAGFGMRYAIRSGELAARSIIEGEDFTRLWRRALMPQLKASITNRFLSHIAGDRGWRWMLVNRLGGTDTLAQLHRLYRPSLVKNLLFPFAQWRYRAPLNDQSCDHRNCSCIWCQHGTHAASNNSEQQIFVAR